MIWPLLVFPSSTNAHKLAFNTISLFLFFPLFSFFLSFLYLFTFSVPDVGMHIDLAHFYFRQLIAGVVCYANMCICAYIVGVDFSLRV